MLLRALGTDLHGFWVDAGETRFNVFLGNESGSRFARIPTHGKVRHEWSAGRICLNVGKHH